MTQGSEKSSGRVCLVGAGPGHAGLITVQGLEMLARAQVVLYDALIDPALLDHAPPDAQRIDVGKRARNHKLTQDQINDLMLRHARAGRFVVRLKGGDPYLFGRGAEEVAYLAAHGVACEVVPGVTSGIAAPAMAGIPVTHRHLASTVTFVTGHEDPTKAAADTVSDTDAATGAVNYAALASLAQAGGTLCFYMGVGRLDAIRRSLSAHGLPADTPAAAVQWGATPRQRCVRSNLGDLPEAVAAAGLGAPAIIVIGRVAGIADPGLDFYMRRPLFGQCVLVTRTRHQASQLSRLLAERGARVIEAATIELLPPDDWTPIDQAIRAVADYDWLILTSVNAVEAMAGRMESLGLDARHLAGVQLAAIGQATVEAMRARLGVRADFVPTRAMAESLAGELLAGQDVRGKQVLLLRADIARPALPRLLSEAGAAVTDLPLYRSQSVASLPSEALEALRQGGVDWITFTSSSTATNLAALLGEERTLLERVKRASIGPITSQTLRELNLPPTIEAAEATIESLAEAMAAAAVS